jgi:hypothetical protein
VNIVRTLVLVSVLSVPGATVIAQTSGTNTTSPATSATVTPADNDAVVNTGKGGYWGLLGLIGLAGLAPLFRRTSTTVVPPTTKSKI